MSKSTKPQMLSKWMGDYMPQRSDPASQAIELARHAVPTTIPGCDDGYTDRLLTGKLTPDEHSMVYESMFPMKKVDDEFVLNDKDSTFKYDVMADYLIDHLDILVFASREKTSMPKRVVMRVDGRYVNAASMIPTIVVYLTKKKVTEQNINKVLYTITNDIGIRVWFEEMQTNNRRANFANGVVDISGETVVFQPRTKEDVFFTRVPINYPVDGGECPVFQEFLARALDPKYHTFIYEWIGYCFFETYEFQHIIFHHGVGGSGKSTLLKLIANVLGSANVSVLSLKQMSHEKFMLNQLDGVMANHGAEVSYRDMKDGVEILKQLSSGVDPVLMEQKYEKAYPIISTAKLSFAMNNIPQQYNEDSGLARRLILIEWLKPMLPKEGRRFNSDEIGMFTPEEIDGVIYNSIQAFQAMVKRSEFSYAPTPEETEKDYAVKSDTLGTFVHECIENSRIHDAAYRDGSPDWVSTNDIFAAYMAWCFAKGVKPKEKSSFNSRYGLTVALKNTTADKARGQYGDTVRLNGYNDIKLVPPADNFDQSTI